MPEPDVDVALSEAIATVEKEYGEPGLVDDAQRERILKNVQNICENARGSVELRVTMLTLNEILNDFYKRATEFMQEPGYADRLREFLRGQGMDR